MFSVEVVEEYYEKCQKYYNWFWSDKESLGMHYGFWYPETKNKKEALINQYREVVKFLKPQPSDMILDAGCGIGGACLWLAERYKCNIVGITLSEKQVNFAVKQAKKRGVSERVEFKKQNFFCTSFPNEKFDKVLAIESFCYSYPNPNRFFQEAYRILKVGGRLVICDGFISREPANKSESNVINGLMIGWKLSGMSTLEQAVQDAEACGFKVIETIKKTDHIIKNVWKIYWRGFLAYPFLWLLRTVRLISLIEYEHVFAILNQRAAVSKGLMEYYILVLEK